MKKSYLYFLVPIVCTAIFAVFYTRYASTYEERIAKMEEAKRLERQHKLEEEANQRKKAIDDAVKATEKRKQEKAEREAREAKERDDRDRAAQERNKAREESRKFAEQVKRLQKDIAENKEEIAKIEQDKKELVEEQVFLKQYVKEAEANTQALTAVMEKIEAADKARAEAERAAKRSS